MRLYSLSVCCGKEIMLWFLYELDINYGKCCGIRL